MCAAVVVAFMLACCGSDPDGLHEESRVRVPPFGLLVVPGDKAEGDTPPAGAMVRMHVWLDASGDLPPGRTMVPPFRDFVLLRVRREGPVEHALMFDDHWISKADFARLHDQDYWVTVNFGVYVKGKRWGGGFHMAKISQMANRVVHTPVRVH